MLNKDYRAFLKILWRRKWWVVLPSAVGLLVAAVVLRELPRVYRASTLVLVEPPKVPADYVKTTVTTSIQERLKTIEQQITNRNNLERIIREMNLYPDLRSAGQIEEAIRKARRSLALQVQGNQVFRIFFSARDPKVAAASANLIADLFIQGNLKLRENQAQGTTNFLEQELGQFKRDLEAQEAKIAAFKKRHMGELPEQRDTNLRAVEQLQTKLQINIDALDKAETRKILLQREIASLRPAGSAAPATPERLQQLRAQLSDLRSRYTERHPEVIRLEAEIARLEDAYRNAPPPQEPPPETTVVDPTLRAEQDSLVFEIRRLKTEQERILQEIARYRERLENTPNVEAGLLSLTRDYDDSKSSYYSLLDKHREAELAERLEERQQSEQFTILEDAVPPREPYSPNSLMVLAVGLGLGGVLGIGLAFFRQETDETYTDSDSLQEDFPAVPLLAVIPRLDGVPLETPAAEAAS